MKTSAWKGRTRISLDPGEYCAKQDKNIVLTTLLGSCVATCLYDPATKIIGMNHFLLSSRRYSRDQPMSHTDAGRYGIHSMELLINDMVKLGASRKNLRAKAFGGANVLQGNTGSQKNFFVIGEVNSRFVQEFLREERIPLEANDLGGNVGRVIHFFSEDYSVLVKKMAHTEDAVISHREEDFWKASIKKYEHPSSTDTSLWG